MNQGSNFLGGSFSNRDNVRALIQFRKEKQPQDFKRWFVLKNKPIHFHINSKCYKTSQMKQVDVFKHWIQQATSCPSLQCLVDLIQVQKPILVVATEQAPDHT